MADHCPAKSFLDNVPNKYHLIVLGAGHVQPGICLGVVIIMTPVCPIESQYFKLYNKMCNLKESRFKGLQNRMSYPVGSN